MPLAPAAKATFISIGLFIVSLVLPGFSYVGGSGNIGTIWGAEALGMGWFPAIIAIAALPSGDATYVPTIAWMANPCVFVAWGACFMGWRRGAIGFAIASAVLALLFVFAHQIPIPDGQTKGDIQLGAGFFIWIAAMAFTIFVACQVNVPVVRAPAARRR